MEGYEKSLKELEQILGDELDLAILRDRLTSAPETYGQRRAVDLVVGAIKSASKELRESALEIGERVYSQKPRRFTKQIGRLWRVWRDKRAQP